MSEELERKREWTWLQIVIGSVAIAVFLWAAIPLRPSSRINYKANQAASVGNCHQIIAALRLWVQDHDGRYPDFRTPGPQTANEVFRILIRDGVLNDERIFGAKTTPFIPDREIGSPPEFSEAVQAGENHWAMTKGVKPSDNGPTPLVFENPSQAGWPPMWDMDSAGRIIRGRAWRGGKIIVGLNDGSVELVKLASTHGKSVPPANDSDGKNVFTRAADHMEILDIEP